VVIVINLDVMLARHKIKSKELAAYIGITEQNLSLLKPGMVKGFRFLTLDNICLRLNCQPGDILEYRADKSTSNTMRTLPAEGEDGETQ